jgi:hypothetical protein
VQPLKRSLRSKPNQLAKLEVAEEMEGELCQSVLGRS